MHGETYDIVLPERGVRVLGEAVLTDFKTQTVRHAWRANGRRWTLEADDQPVVGFKGTHLDFYLNWRDEIQFEDGERFGYRKPTSILGGLLGRKHTLHHTGTIEVRSSEGLGVDLAFLPEPGMLSGRFGRGPAPPPHRVAGVVIDAITRTPLPNTPKLQGAWHIGLDAVAGDGARTRLWTPLERDPAARYDMTPFAARLNALDTALDAVLPPTDARRRPDLRALEEGRFEEAHSLKVALENALSSRLKRAGGCPPPRWFEVRSEGILGAPGGDQLRYRYKGGYWESRAKGEWEGVDDAIFDAAKK